MANKNTKKYNNRIVIESSGSIYYYLSAILFRKIQVMIQNNRLRKDENSLE